MSFVQSIIKNTRELLMLDKDAATVTTINEVLAKDGTGLVIPASGTTVRSELEGICNQSIAAAEALTRVPAIVISSEDVFIADTRANSDIAHNYQRMVLVNSLVVANTGTDDASGILQQVGVYGASTDKKILCRFL